MPNPYAPPGESAADLWLERSNFSGEVLCAVAYGVHLTVYSICTYYLVLNLRHGRGKRNIPFLVYTFILFFLGTLILAGNTKFTEEMWIDDRNIPGGPNAWLMGHYNDPSNIMMCGSYAAANFFADGILIWRAYIFWNNIYIIVLPCLIFIASTVTSVFSVYYSSRPDFSLWSPETSKFLLPYFSLSLALNLLLTILIVGRLLYLSRHIKTVLGEAHARTYTSVAAMMIESAAPLSVTSLVFIITYALNSNVQNLVLPILSEILCIAPEMIILRVARGHAWTTTNVKSSTMERVSGPMAFRAPMKVSVPATSVALSDFTPQGSVTKSSSDNSTMVDSKFNLTGRASSGEYV